MNFSEHSSAPTRRRRRRGGTLHKSKTLRRRVFISQALKEKERCNNHSGSRGLWYLRLGRVYKERCLVVFIFLNHFVFSVYKSHR